MRGVLLLVAALCAVSVGASAPQSFNERHFPTANERSNYFSSRNFTRIAFGSCSSQHAPDANFRIWDVIGETQPDLWLWTGDAVYNDRRVMPAVWKHSPPPVMRAKYNMMKTQPRYANFTSSVPVIGVPDDHDFGENNMDYTSTLNKTMAKQLYLDFLSEPADSEARRADGGYYQSIQLGSPGALIKIFLLDTRSQQTKEDLLGEEQWEWFERELNSSRAQLNIVVSGIQMIAPDKPLQEKWARFPESFNRFFKTLRRANASRVIVISGDVHYAEILSTECGTPGYPIYEFTSSGLTHSLANATYFGGVLGAWIVKSYHRISSYVGINFGLLEVDWDTQELRVSMRDSNGDVQIRREVDLTELEAELEPEAIPNCLRDYDTVWYRLTIQDALLIMAIGAIGAAGFGLALAIYIWVNCRIQVEFTPKASRKKSSSSRRRGKSKKE